MFKTHLWRILGKETGPPLWYLRATEWMRASFVGSLRFSVESTGSINVFYLSIPTPESLGTQEKVHVSGQKQTFAQSTFRCV
jgi:hypothetical protein